MQPETVLTVRYSAHESADKALLATVLHPSWSAQPVTVTRLSFPTRASDSSAQNATGDATASDAELKKLRKDDVRHVQQRDTHREKARAAEEKVRALRRELADAQSVIRQLLAQVHDKCAESRFVNNSWLIPNLLAAPFVSKKAVW